MPPIAIALLLGSAMSHAAWNIRLKGSNYPEQAAATAVIPPGIAVGAALTLAWAAGLVQLPLEVLLLGVAAGAAELAYFLTLARAYGGAPISVIYPLVRGVNPLVAIFIGIALLGETLHGSQPYGVALVVIGLFIIQPPFRTGAAGAAPRAIAFAVTAGIFSAIGSGIERSGVLASDPLTFLSLTWGVTGLLYLVVAVQRTNTQRPTASLVLTGALIIFGHLLVMGALAVAPLSIVVPLRESAILLVSGWGLLRFRDAAGRRAALLRAAGALVILLGAILIALG
ncbi:MAG: hypothetical protein ACO3BX_03730 [Candidatus Limnocylindrus sp.]